MSSRKVAVVTGSNKGIGYAIVKGLCEKYDGDVYLTSRNTQRGQDAVNKLKTLGLNPLFHQLDITDENSVNNFRDHIKSKHGGLDVLINNAGVYASKSLPMGEQAESDVGVNYFGTLRVCHALFPLLRTNGRVVNVSSSAGRLQRIPSTGLQAKFKDPSLTIESLSNLMQKYIKDAKENRHIEEGWGESAYVVSKVGVNALTILQQKLFDQEPDRNLSANSVHPGYVDTDMTLFMADHKEAMSIEQGAKGPLFLALEANLKGKYVWFDCRVVDWDGPLPQDAKENRHIQEGWGESAYVVSKVGVTALTILQQKLFDQEPNRNLSANSVHPGYVDTDMTDHKGALSIEQGAKGPLFLALEANLKGKYVWFDCCVVDWDGPLPQ